MVGSCRRSFPIALRLSGTLQDLLQGTEGRGSRRHRGELTGQADAPVLAGHALDVPFPLQGIQAVEHGLIRSDLTAGLNLAD